MGALFYVSIIGWAMVVKAFRPLVSVGSSLLTSLLGMISAAYVLIIVVGDYYVAPYLIIIGGWVALIGSFAVLAYQKRVREMITSTFLIFVLLCSILVSVVGNHESSMHDYYSFWGRAVKELHVFKTSYINEFSNIAHSDYNPIMASLQYCVTIVFGWENKYLNYVVIAYFVVAIVAMLDSMRTKNYGYRLLFSLLVLFALAVFGNGTAHLLADPLVALTVPLIVILFEGRQRNNAHELPLMLSVFVLTGLKIYVGFWFSIVLVLWIGITQYKDKCEHSTLMKALRLPAILLLCLGAMQFSWSYVYNYQTAVAAENKRFEMQAFLGNADSKEKVNIDHSIKYMFGGNPRSSSFTSKVNADSVKNVLKLAKDNIKEFTTNPISSLTIRVTVVQAFMIVAAVFIILSIISPRQRFPGLVAIVIATIGYVVGLFLTYFVQEHAASGAIRYMGVPLLIAVIYLLYHIICSAVEIGSPTISSKVLLTIVATFLIAFSQPSVVRTAYSSSPRTYPIQRAIRNDISTMGPILTTLSKADRVLIIDAKNPLTGAVSFYHYYYQYSLLPVRVDLIPCLDSNGKFDSKVTKELIDNRVMTNRISKLILFLDHESFQKYFKTILGPVVHTNDIKVFNVKIRDRSIKYEEVIDLPGL